VNGLIQLFNRLGLQRVAAMAVVAVLMLGFFAFLIMRASTPQMAPLYTGLSLEDSSAIVDELQKQNVPNEIRGEGDTILVPRDQITTIRMQLAENGLPTKGQVGYEIFDQQNSLGATSFVQNINNVRALEGELARTISSLARIKSTRVHLVLPERALFSRDKKDPTASIVVSVRGQLAAEEIRAIQHLVASAVEGLTPNRVTIADDTGNLLAAGAGDGNESSVIAGEADERRVGLENRLRTSIEGLLANIVGEGRARVEVSADLDLTHVTKTAQTFDPNGQVVRSTQTKAVASNSTDAKDSGQVSASTQLPGATSTTSGVAGASEAGSTDEETTNYEISNVSQTEMTDPGAVKRLSVAVVVDGTYTTDAQGNSVYAPRDQSVLDQIKSLVQSAIGFDQTRGDQITVANLQFAQGPTPSVVGTSGPGLFDFTRDDLINGAEMLVTLIIALALVFFVMRPLLKRVLSPEVQPLALPVSAEISQPQMVAAHNAQGTAMTEMVADDHPAPTPAMPGWIKDARSQGAAQAQTMKTVGTLVQENPKQAALIVRDWLSSAV
jgi:flagellar M-ring protein FliF